MGTKKFRPLTPSLRYKTVSDFAEITRTVPEKSLLEPLHSSGGRDNKGHTSTWYRGGGHKRRYRIIDFRRDKRGIPGRVDSIEYDPNRTARIALLVYVDGEKRYIVAPDGLKVGDRLEAGPEVEIRVGNALPLRAIPLGTNIHNLELIPGRGGQVARGAGCPRARFAFSTRSATARLARSAISTTKISSSARPGVRAGRGVGRIIAAYR